jgi:hypothetical protein
VLNELAGTYTSFAITHELHQASGGREWITHFAVEQVKLQVLATFLRMYSFNALPDDSSVRTPDFRPHSGLFVLTRESLD